MIRLLAATPALTVLLLAAPAWASSGRFTLPLPAKDLPDGVLTVKVVGDNLRDLKVGQEVQLLRVEAGGGAAPMAKVKTGADGRARFEGLSASQRYVVTVEREPGRAAAEPTEHRSAPFAGPRRGGVRLLLTLGAATMPGDRSADLPPGRPPSRLPPGHPPTSQPAAGEPEEAGAATLEADPALDRGQLQVVVVRGRRRRPLAGAAVTLQLLGPKAGAKPAERALPETDDRGTTRVTLARGDRRHRAQVTHDGLTYRSRSFETPPSGGLRATFQVFDRIRDVGRLSLGRGSHWVSQVGEGVVRFMQVIELANEADAIVDPGRRLAFPLPDGARRVEIPTELRGILVLDEPGRRVRLAAPVPPGGLPLRFYFEVPYRGATLDFRQVLPLPQGPSAMVLMSGGRTRLLGPAIAGEARPNEGGEGTVYPVAAAARGRAVEVTFTDLPHRDRGPLHVALGLAALVALWGLLAAVGGPRAARRRRERREELLARLARMSREQAGSTKKPRAREKSSENREQLRQELIRVWEEW